MSIFDVFTRGDSRFSPGHLASMLPSARLPAAWPFDSRRRRFDDVLGAVTGAVDGWLPRSRTRGVSAADMADALRAWAPDRSRRGSMRSGLLLLTVAGLAAAILSKR